ncbi:MAG: glycosyltransferase [Phycisphaeraceae bacterium]
MHPHDPPIDALIARHEASWRIGYDAFPAVVHAKGLRRGVEVGVAFGGHSGAILEQGGVDKLFGVDAYRHRDNYDDPMNLDQPVFDRLAERVVDRLAPFGDRFELVRDDSQQAGDRFADKSLDFVYLDADHSEQGVWQDLCTWAIKVRPGGVIAGHDYGHADFPGVRRAVDRFFARFGWTVHEAGHNVWWVERERLPITYFTPAYNCAAWIDDAAASILEHNLAPGDEYLIVNDGSTDETADKLSAIAANFAAVRIVTHAANRGGSAARNTAVAEASNPLCFCLDADNLVPPDSVAPLRDHLFRTGVDTTGFQTLRYFSDEQGPDHITGELVYETNLVDFQRAIATTRVPAGSGNYLFTKDAWRRAGGYPEGVGALDAWGFGLRKAATGSTANVLPGSHYHHRRDHASYWTRHEGEGTIDRTALDILRPYLDRLDPRDAAYLETEAGRDRWFSTLNERPLRLRNAASPTIRRSAVQAGLSGLIRRLLQRAA